MYNGYKVINHKCGVCLPVPISHSSQEYNPFVQRLSDILSFKGHRANTGNFYSLTFRVEDQVDCLINSRMANDSFSEVILLLEALLLSLHSFFTVRGRVCESKGLIVGQQQQCLRMGAKLFRKWLQVKRWLLRTPSNPQRPSVTAIQYYCGMGKSHTLDQVPLLHIPVSCLYHL